MRLYRLVGVKRFGHSAYREHGMYVKVRAKSQRAARLVVAQTLTPKEVKDKTSPWLNSSTTRCVLVPHAPVKGKRAGMVTR